MRVPHIFVSAMILAASAALVAVTSAAAATGAPVSYAALGDSYSAGVGTNDYIGSSGACDRSPEGYPSLWDKAHSVSTFDFVACSGAKTTDVIANQLGGLSASTNVVSITVGGNDAGFADVMKTCVLNGDSACTTAVNNAETFVRNTLPGLLDKVYGDIHNDAPNAHVVALGYPEFYQVGGSCSVGLSDNSRTEINGGADLLDLTISDEAEKYGFTFADVRGAFASHEICSSDSWLNAVAWPISDSYHPKAAGYSGAYLPVLDSATG